MSFTIGFNILFYIILIASAFTAGKYRGYDGCFIIHIDRVLEKTNLSEDIKSEMKLNYLNRHLPYKSLVPNFFLSSTIILGICSVIKSFLANDSPKFMLIPVFILLIILHAILLGAINGMGEASSTGFTFNDTNKDIINFYFDTNYSSISSILNPIYKHARTDTARYHLLANIETSNQDEFGHYISRFGNSLNNFTLLFEKASTETASERVFISELLKSKNVGLIAKLIVILEDTVLIEQLVNEQGNATSKVFNDSLEQMIESLESEVDKIQKLSEETLNTEETMIKYKKATEAREKLDLLVGQDFTLIE